jgi:hypothetical protein
VPVYFTGKVLDDDNKPLERARITSPDVSNVIFNQISVSAESGYNVTIVLYDHGDAKDDVFSLYVSGIGDIGTTPEGVYRSYLLQFPHDIYTVTVTVLDDGGNFGTFTLNVFINGVSVKTLKGEPKAGGSLSVNFHMEN